MSDSRSYDLTAEVSQAQAEKPKPRGRGDGWTLDEHLAEHRRLPSAVNILDEHDQLTIRHHSPGRWVYWTALLVVAGLVAASFVMKKWPAFGDFTGAHWGGLAGLALLLVGLLLAAITETRMVLNDTGLFVRRWPFWPGSRVSVPLSSVRRFKVEKPGKGKKAVYHLNLLTQEEDRYRIVPRIKLKRDAYLLAMLLIERVKQRRQH